MSRTHIAFILDSSGSMGVIKEPVIASYNDRLSALRKTQGLGVSCVGGTGTWRQKNQVLDMQVTGTLTLFGHKRPGYEPVQPRVYYPPPWNPWQQPVAYSTNTAPLVDSAYNVEIKFLGQALYDIQPLTTQTYEPFGNTPLYDALGLTLERMQNELPYSEGDAYLVMVFSDGEENYSKYWTQERLRSLVMELQGSGKWTFTFQGADRVGIEQFMSLGVPRANTYSFTPTFTGVAVATAANTASVQSYMQTRAIGGMAVADFYGNPSTAHPVEPIKSRIVPPRKRAIWKK